MGSKKLSLPLAKYLSWIAGAVMALLPLHAFLTTWVGVHTGHMDLVRIWKEVVIVVVAICAIRLLFADRLLAKQLFRDWLTWLIIWYILLHLLFAAAALGTRRVNGSAAIYALLANLRMFGFFLVTYVLAKKHVWLREHWVRLVVWPAAVVVGFGLLQKVLPPDFLTHFGYGPHTIPAIQTIDNKLNFIRIQSTLRGANPLGAYLLVIISLLTALVIRHRYKRWQLGALLLGAVVALFFSYSRSAWLGLALSVFLIGYWTLEHPKLKRGLLAMVVAMVLLLASGLWLVRHNDTAENTIFHTSNTSASSESSNAARLRAIQTGWQDVWREPLGRGPGTAGPASVRNSKPARISENYFLQVAQEVGLLGLTLFVAIYSMVGWRLYVRRQSALALGLAAALMGLVIVNLLSHAWADDTLGLFFFGLAGVALSD